jgi:carbonic anhydrase
MLSAAILEIRRWAAGIGEDNSMPPLTTSRRSFLASGLVAAGGVLTSLPAAAALPQTQARPASPDEALRRLQAGNARFVRGKTTAPRATNVRRAKLVEGQAPFAVVLGCADSRLPPELVFDQGLGDLFTVRVAGNTAAAPALVGSVEYAASILGSALIVVLGHDDCGAVKAAIDVVTKGKSLPGQLAGFVEPIVPAIQAVQNVGSDQLLQAAVSQNIRQAVAALAAQSLVADAIAAGKLKVVGAEYRLSSGKVDILS